MKLLVTVFSRSPKLSAQGYFLPAKWTALPHQGGQAWKAALRQAGDKRYVLWVAKPADGRLILLLDVSSLFELDQILQEEAGKE